MTPTCKVTVRVAGDRSLAHVRDLAEEADNDPTALFGRRLRTARIAAGLTAADVAGILGCTQATVSRWETGDRTPTLHDLPGIASAVGTSVADLLGFSASDAAFRNGWRACV